MPKNKALETSRPESIEEAWDKGDDLAMARAVVRKFARVLDMTDEGRVIKPLVAGMFEAVDRVRAIEEREAEGTPLADIMGMAEDA